MPHAPFKMSHKSHDMHLCLNALAFVGFCSTHCCKLVYYASMKTDMIGWESLMPGLVVCRLAKIGQ